MNTKEDNIQKFYKANRYDLRLKRKVEQLVSRLDNAISEREAIQRIEENHRKALSGEKLGSVFQGNSNKYYHNNVQSYIQNRVQQRNNLKKDYSLYM